MTEKTMSRLKQSASTRAATYVWRRRQVVQVEASRALHHVHRDRKRAELVAVGAKARRPRNDPVAHGRMRAVHPASDGRAARVDLRLGRCHLRACAACKPVPVVDSAVSLNLNQQ